jgi:hypothetical protein
MRRWTPLSGAAFALLFALATALYGGGAGSNATDIVVYYARPAERRHQKFGFAVLLLACLLLLPYLAVLRTRLARSEPGATVVLLSGGAAAVLLMIANGLWATTAFTVEIQGAGTVVAPSAHLLLEDAAFVLVVTAAAAAIPMVMVTCVDVLRHGGLPRWFAGLGLLAVVGLASAYLYRPLVAFLAWLAAGSVLLARQRHDSTAAGASIAAEAG